MKMVETSFGVALSVSNQKWIDLFPVSTARASGANLASSRANVVNLSTAASSLLSISSTIYRLALTLALQRVAIFLSLSLGFGTPSTFLNVEGLRNL